MTAADRRPPASRTAIVLAGGDGERLRAFTTEWLGTARPKQYCAFVGSRSMFDHTLDRAAQWCERRRVISVVADHHREVLGSRAAVGCDGRFVFQPRNRDTAPGILLGLSYALHESPDAIVAIFPSDHFIRPESRFLRAVRAAGAAAASLPDHLILLGTPARDPEDEYGWILPGEPLLRIDGRPVRAVRSFLEKPAPPVAVAAKAAGAVWNTFVIVARAQSLWEVTSAALPDLVPYFTRLREAIGTPDELAVRADIYRTMPSRNFSSDVLARQTDRVAVLTLEGVEWSDWGRPERIVDTLTALGARPSFVSAASSGRLVVDSRIAPVGRDDWTAKGDDLCASNS